MKNGLRIILIIMLVCLTGCGNSSDQDKTGKEDRTEKTVAIEQTSEESTTESHTEDEKEEENTGKTPDGSEGKTDSEDNKSEQDNRWIQLMPNVTVEMQDPEYWINKTEDPDKIIMTPEEIRAFNQDIRVERAEIRKYLKHSTGDGERTISREELTDYLGDMDIPDESWKSDGKILDQAWWDELFDNVNYEGIQETNTLSYGFVVERTPMRGYPSEEIAYSGEKFTFFDEFQLSSLLVGEPVILAHCTKDKKWAFIITKACTGWVHVDSIALSEDYASWRKDCDSKHFLIVTGDEITLEYDPDDRDISNKILTMGTKLPLLPIEKHPEAADGRRPYGNYLVKVPARKKGGKLVWKYAYVPVSRKVHVGYPDLTVRNILEIAFDSLGNRYGWGGMYDARDCSLYVMELYRCFGIILPRNTTGQSAMNSETIEAEEMTDKKKREELDTVPAGSILYMQGHVALYLGKDKDNYYAISASAAPIPEGSEKRVDVQSVIINDLNAKRKDGITWLSHIEKIKIIRRPQS